MVIGKIGSYLVLGLVGAFLIMSLTNPQRALATTQALGGGGRALGEYGSGFRSLFTGIGEGGARLFDPLFTLRDLIYGPQAGVQTPKDVQEVVTTTPSINTRDIIQTQKAIEASPQSQFTPLPFARPAPAKQSEPNILDTLWNRIFPPAGALPSPIPVNRAQTYTVHGQTLPLSQAAITHYQNLGVTVSPSSNNTVASQNSSNATSASSSGVSFASSGHSGSWSGGGFRAAN